MTGAPIPPGADAIVMVERTTVDGDRVEVRAQVGAGNHIRRSGEDVCPGDTVIDAGTVVTPAHLGVLLSVGCGSLPIVPCPRVAVMSTGDELVADGRDLRPGEIVDSNRPSLLALVEAAGFIAVDQGLVPDDESAIEAGLASAAAGCDAVVTSGGVSMGDFDYVKVVLDRIGQMRWMQVAIKPAKPLAFGLIDDTPVFGLPGNPVSSMVSFELFARPALRRMMGHPRPDAPMIPAVAAEPLPRRNDDKVHFARVSALGVRRWRRPRSFRWGTGLTPALGHGRRQCPGRPARRGRSRRRRRGRPSCSSTTSPTCPVTDRGAWAGTVRGGLALRSGHGFSAADRLVRAGAPGPADLDHRSVQLPLHVLHARGGDAVDASQRGAHLRGDRAGGHRLRRAVRVRLDTSDRGRTHRSSPPAGAGPQARFSGGRSVDDDQRGPRSRHPRPSCVKPA